MTEPQRVITREFAANYPGDVRHIIGEVKGPNTMGEYFVAETADYDEQTRKTRVTFTLLGTWMRANPALGEVLARRWALAREAPG